MKDKIFMIFMVILTLLLSGLVYAVSTPEPLIVIPRMNTSGVVASEGIRSEYVTTGWSGTCSGNLVVENGLITGCLKKSMYDRLLG